MNIAILGSGMAGLLAAKAVEEIGNNEFVIFSDKIESPPGDGLHYLHDGCGIQGIDSFEIRNFVGPEKLTEGICREELVKMYSRKMGIESNVNSISRLPICLKDFEIGCDMNQAYERLFCKYEGNIFLREVDKVQIFQICKEFDLVISTIPQNILSDFPDKYKTSEVYVTEQYLGRDSLSMKNIVEYNLDEDTSWSRTSTIRGNYHRGKNYTEWSEKPFCDKEDYFVLKKIVTNHDYFIIPQIHKLQFIGRLGTWNKSTLAHEAYYRTRKMLKRYV